MLAVLALAAPAFAQPPAAGSTASATTATMRAIARAEDERNWSDGTLRRSLGDPSSAVRARAVLAVGRLQDSTTVPALLPLLADSSVAVRHGTAFALGQIGHASAREALERELASGDPEMVALAIEALGKIANRSSTRAITRLLSNGSARLRGEAAIALWRIGDSTAIDPLLARHRDPDPEVRWKVMYALEKIVNPDRIALVAALHLSDAEWLTRAYAVRTLGRQRSNRGTAYVLQSFADTEPAVVVNAVRALQLIADSTCGSCAPALTRLLSHGHPYVRSSAATAFGDRFTLAAADSTARKAALDSLTTRLRDGDAATRGAAARALVVHRGAAGIPAAEAMLADTSVYARAAAIRALADAPGTNTTPRLLEVFQRGAHLFDRMNAAEALGQRRATEALPRLRDGLRDTTLLMVAACASALGEMGDTASVAALVSAYAARARNAGADARIAIRDDDARIAIREALRQLRGAAYADSIERAHPPANVRPATTADDFADPPAERGAILHTTAGEIEWAFAGDMAPQTIKNFVRLAARGYFDGTAFHRVVPNFVIQDGDPTGTGSGGPGYTIRCEYNTLRYDPGMVGMALAGKDTGGSQWFITHSPQPHLNGRYTIFARVTRGMDVVHRIVQGDRILRVEILR